jgi:DNA mismatch endonuclease, patch repair protein
MSDHLSRADRSRNMAKIKGRDTQPERIVRSLLHRIGYRFRLHSKKLKGRPDIVLPKHKKLILVHGCFWHSHDCVRGLSTPKTNSQFWIQKRSGNVERDKKLLLVYATEGWSPLVIWECETRDTESLEKKLLTFLRKARRKQ